MRNYCLFVLLALYSCNIKKDFTREILELKGTWQFALDTAREGKIQKWYSLNLTDSIYLPGTTDIAKKGFLNLDSTTLHLSRIYKYEGLAWYRKKVIIPERFKNKYIELSLERSKLTNIWVDSTFVASSKILQSAQKFDLTKYLSPGEHYISIEVNNDLKLTPFGNVHIYSDHTQTNWNGIIGKIYLEASEKTHIQNLQVYPDIDHKKAKVVLDIVNDLNLDKLDVELFLEKVVEGKIQTLKSLKSSIAYQPKVELDFELNELSNLWSEYEQPIYTIRAEISNGNIKDAQTTSFGMRKFSIAGTQFTINGQTTFLRGKNDAAVFPLTGHIPMEKSEWLRLFKMAKSYGINHYRFHTYCPPDAAFAAADEVGIYIQAELPLWSSMDTDSLTQTFLEEGNAMIKSYANHPSFVMFSHGNEMWADHDRFEKNINAFKAYDNRLLYTTGSNFCLGKAQPRKCSDYFLGVRVPGYGDSIKADVRLTQSIAETKNGGILNSQTPSTLVNFDFAVSTLAIPVVSHEIGQYQVFPNYSEINKYKGILRPRNLEVFRNRLLKAGMLAQDSIFQKASGAWAAICYKAEMEAALRTQKMGGFQLLDLQDFPGQGTALVGILDAFMDSKNVISPELWRQSCNDVVILLEFPKYCWTNQETFQAKIKLANYSNKKVSAPLNWEIKKQNGVILGKGILNTEHSKNACLSSIGVINQSLSGIDNAQKLSINISLPNSEYSNTYPIWVYPTIEQRKNITDIIVAEQLNSTLISQLNQGAKVLLFPQTKDVVAKSLPGMFITEFWNYGMFKGISEWLKNPVSPGTMGILTNPKHPIFKEFPTDYHTNWQWFSIINSSNSLILDDTKHEYLPIVQTIDNLERNHKLGLIFEFRVGNGKLLVCMSQLNQLKNKPEAAQLYRSIIDYMNSPDFAPDYVVSKDELNKMLLF